MKIRYVPKKFKEQSLRLIEQANQICEEYDKQGYVLTLRQLYYQFVSRDILPNTLASYKNLGSVINDGRLAGLIDWKFLEDRTRNLKTVSHWDSPADVIASAAYGFALDKWEGQPYYVELWVEKEALAAVVERAAWAMDLGYFSCRGYVSQSEMHAAALRYKEHARQGRTPRVIHLGDHDPSGIDMTRDVEERIRDTFGVSSFEINRIALNMDQIQQYNPPPNPAKQTDARFERYLAEHGDESWELDALEPKILEQLIYTAVNSYRVKDLFERRKTEENKGKALLKDCSRRWDEVVDFLQGNDPDGGDGGETIACGECYEDKPVEDFDDDDMAFDGSITCRACKEQIALDEQTPERDDDE